MINKILICLVILLVSCSGSSYYIGKSKKEVIIMLGTPYIEKKYNDMDVLQYKYNCHYTRGYCDIQEFIFEKNICVTDVWKTEQIPKSFDLNINKQ